MKVAEAEGRMRDMLAESMGNAELPNVDMAWLTFKDFARIPVDCESDMFLFECGVYTFTGREMFHFDLVRQFTVYTEQEGEYDYDHMEQLHCEFLFEPTPELHAFKLNLWAAEGGPLDEFFAAVEALPAFQATRKLAPTSFEVSQTEV